MAAMTGALTTHVLDVAHGRPASGVGIELWRDEMRIAAAATNADGRTEAPLVAPGSLEIGVYELRFAVGAYFASSGITTADLPFLDIVPVRFGISDAGADHHVPLLVTPWSYSTYRGS
jgi:hydroxyisourate hydrolase